MLPCDGSMRTCDGYGAPSDQPVLTCDCLVQGCDGTVLFVMLWLAYWSRAPPSYAELKTLFFAVELSTTETEAVIPGRKVIRDSLPKVT